MLAGVLTSTALYSVSMFVMGSGNVSLAASDSFVNLANRGRALLGLPESVTLFGTSVSGGNIASLIVVSLLVLALALGLARFLGTDLGLAMRAAGQNPRMARAVSIDVNLMIILGLGLSNGLIALSGALQAQYEGFANIQMAIGAVVTGVATLMVGETLFGRRRLGRWIAGAAVGAVAFRLLVALAIRAGLHPNALKLVTAVFVLAVLVIPNLVQKSRQRRPASGAPTHA
jgi:putative ABC transport system permease protein